MSSGGGGELNPAFVEWLMGYEQMFTTQLLPTPLSSTYKGSKPGRYWSPTEQTGYRGQLHELVELTPYGKTGPLSPTFVEWLMGYQTEWTASNVLETQ